MRFRIIRMVRLTALTLSAVLLCGCAAQSVKAPDQNNTKSESSESSAVTEQAPPQELSVTDLLKSVLTLKEDLKQAVDNLAKQDLDSADEGLAKVSEKTDTIRRSLEITIANLGNNMPAVTKQLENVQVMLDMLDILDEQILQPTVDMLQTYPLDALSTSEGVQVNVLGKYIDFAENLMPAVESLAAQAEDADLSIVDSDGVLTEKLEQAKKLAALYRQDPSAFTALKAILGIKGNRSYLLAAQNTAEIRASGGFPGAMGILQIQDGTLAIQDFETVYNVLSTYTPSEAQITTQESNLFHGGLSSPRDADFCPDFERVASIWALGYEARQENAVDGVISMTPVVVQRLLDAMGEEITLFDGTTMDGSNACRVLQYDLYYKYCGSERVQNGQVILDRLFADAAKKTSSLLTEHLDAETAAKYLDVMRESLNDRTLMLWMKDETEQGLIRKLGWDGGLNADPEKPKAGVYVNCIIASKMGTFLEMDTSAGERTLNSDGSYTYPITVTFRNSMTKEEVSRASTYITGGSNGNFLGSAYFFAPASGTIDHFSSDSVISVRKETYHDLQLGFLQSLYVTPGSSLTITYDVTTAPGVEAELSFSKTPTIQDYR